VVAAERRALVELTGIARSCGFVAVGATLGYGSRRASSRLSMQMLDALIAAGASRIRLQEWMAAPHATRERARLVEQLARAGFAQIGIDDYALREDEAVAAQRFGRVVCKPFGLSARRGGVVVPLGPDAIGATADAYFQHVERAVPSSHATAFIQRGRASSTGGAARTGHEREPALRGWRLCPDDHVRRSVIQSLATNFFIDRQAIELAHNIEFATYFAPEVRVLERCAMAGLVEVNDGFVEPTEAGRLRLANLCAVFDRCGGLRRAWLARLSDRYDDVA
jgi:oxygen-independent coproporphyrinogen-3 oxidase